VVWRLGIGAGFILLISGPAGCLLYTDGINVAPMVSIIRPDPIVRGAGLTFSAQVLDDQTVPFQYRWGAAHGGCPGTGALPVDTFASDTTPAFMVQLDHSGDHCVFVSVTDDHGATSSATTDVHVDNRQPSAVISRVGAATPAPGTQIPLYSDLRFTGHDRSTDPDPADRLTYSWTLTPPAGAAGSPPACNDGATDDACFSVDQVGTYLLVMVASDNEDTAVTQLSFEVADQRPCIVATDPPFAVAPIVHDPSLDLSLAVTGVDDDGDPLPAPANRPSMASFVWAWRIGGSGQFTRLATYDLPTYNVPAGSFQSGQTLEVRVEAHDRVQRVDELLACYQMQPQPLVCVVAPACDQWVTWTVELR
jgi:hypothetical protein